MAKKLILNIPTEDEIMEKKSEIVAGAYPYDGEKSYDTKFIEPAKLNPNHIKLDLSDLIKYAKSKGVRVCDLSDEEKSVDFFELLFQKWVFLENFTTQN